MNDEKPKCFTEEEIKKLKELGKDAVRHSLSEGDFMSIKDIENRSQEGNE